MPAARSRRSRSSSAASTASAGSTRRQLHSGQGGMTQVRIFDTTLRDGEQAPGFSMTEAGKLKMARALAALRVDVIEAGFAAASPGDFRALEGIAREVEGPIICSLARATRGDILAAAMSLEAAPQEAHPRLPRHQPDPPRGQAADGPRAGAGRDPATASLTRASSPRTSNSRPRTRSAPSAISWSNACPPPPPRARPRSTCPTRSATPRPRRYTTCSAISVAAVDARAGVIFSAHCHDDLGMAVANSLAAVRGGARQVECAVNGIGERAGNCALEDVVMALKTRSDTYGVSTGVDTTRIMAASRTLAQITNVPPPRNKAIVGANAFAHEAGIHQHGVLQNRETYEIMKPEDIGLATDGIVLGKHSGRHALAARAKALGYMLEGEALDRAFAAFKEIADEVGIVDTARLVAMLAALEGGGREKLWTPLQGRDPRAGDGQRLAGGAGRAGAWPSRPGLRPRLGAGRARRRVQGGEPDHRRAGAGRGARHAIYRRRSRRGRRRTGRARPCWSRSRSRSTARSSPAAPAPATSCRAASPPISTRRAMPRRCAGCAPSGRRRAAPAKAA